MLWIFGPGVVLGVSLIALWYTIGLLRRQRAQREQAALKLAAEKAAAEAAAAEKVAALTKKATLGLERATAEKAMRSPGHLPARSPARSPGHRRRLPSARGEARVRAALTELGVERAHARLRHARSTGACWVGHGSIVRAAHTAGMGLDPVNTSQEWSVHRAGMGLAGDIANHGMPSATLSAAERRVLEALQLQRELESTIQLLISTKVLTRPKTAAGGGTVAADQLQLQQASAIKLLEC